MAYFHRLKQLIRTLVIDLQAFQNLESFLVAILTVVGVPKASNSGGHPTDGGHRLGGQACYSSSHLKKKCLSFFI